MRITGGRLKGRVLKIQANTAVRPTSEKVREAIFSVLQGYNILSNSTVLDLYAGSGALGIEALSRGADSGVFVEQNPEIAKSLMSNLTKLGLEDNAAVRIDSVDRFLCDKRQGKATVFDLVFADPPYADNPGEELLDRLVQGEFVNAGSLLVLECKKQTSVTLIKSGYDYIVSPVLVKEKLYGGTRVLFIGFENTRQ